MDNYINEMENYTPGPIGATGGFMNEEVVVDSNGLPKATTSKHEPETVEDIPRYLVPKTIEVFRYSLKK